MFFLEIFCNPGTFCQFWKRLPQMQRATCVSNHSANMARVGGEASYLFCLSQWLKSLLAFCDWGPDIANMLSALDILCMVSIVPTKNCYVSSTLCPPPPQEVLLQVTRTLALEDKRLWIIRELFYSNLSCADQKDWSVIARIQTAGIAHAF